MDSFTQAIDRFKLLPKVLHSPTAVAFLGGELVVVVAMILGGKFLLWGFLLAGLLLLLFSIALASVLVRKIPTSCNCFGSSQKPVSIFDIVRNTILILFSLGAYGWLALNEEALPALGWLDWGLLSVAALVLVMILIQLKEIVQLFR